MSISFPAWLMPAVITLAFCGFSSMMTFGYFTDHRTTNVPDVALLVLWLVWAGALAVSAAAWAIYFAVMP